MTAADSRLASAPLSDAQQAIWLAEELGTGGPAYHLHIALSLSGRADQLALRQALDEVTRRHSVLRTVIAQSDGEPRQYVQPPGPADFAVIDLSGEAGSAASWHRHDLVTRHVARPWALSSEWPLRARLVVLPDGQAALSITIHHIAADASSVELLTGEIAELYGSYSRGQPPGLPPVRRQYVDIAREQHDRRHDEKLLARAERWRGLLAGAPAVTWLPLDRPRPAAADAGGGSVRLAVTPELAAGIQRLARAGRTSVFTVLLTAFALALDAYGAGPDLVLAVPHQERDEPETRGVLGCLVNVLPVRLRLDAGTAREALRDARAAVLAALELRDVPFGVLLGRLGIRRDPAVPPLAQVSVRLVDAARRDFDFGDLRAAVVSDGEADAVKYDLALAAEQDGQALSARLEYRRCLFDEPTARRIGQSVVVILEQITADPDLPVAALQANPRPVLRAMVERWSCAELPPAIAERVRPAARQQRCYVLDRRQRLTPVNVPGELHLGETAPAVPPGGDLTPTGIRCRWTPAGDLQPVPAGADAGPAGQREAGSGEAGSGQVARDVSSIWAELLGAGALTPAADFFADLGGDSLLAIRLMSRIRKRLGVRMRLKDVFQNSTLGQMADFVEAAARVAADAGDGG